jgi:hypothetical protein
MSEYQSRLRYQTLPVGLAISGHTNVTLTGWEKVLPLIQKFGAHCPLRGVPGIERAPGINGVQSS